MLFLDNLRWTVILLVISMHAADTYSPLGNWYFTDRTLLSTPTLIFFAAWQMYLQSFFMGLLFFISGYFVPSSFDRKGPGQFIRDRLFRLGLPVLFYMFVLGPLTEYYVAHSWTSTDETSMANEWIKHIRNGEFLQENGPLWFCLALLIFSVAYAASRTVTRSQGAKQKDTRPPAAARIFGFAIVLTTATFLVRATKPPSVLNMHLGDFAQYVLMFAAGVSAGKTEWLCKLRFSSGIRWLALVVPFGFIAWLAILITGGALEENGLSNFEGWHWQAAAICLWESFTCVALSLGLLVIFREYLDTQGRVATFLSQNAFSVYVFHPPIVILGARLLQGVAWHPFFKFLAVTAIGILGTFSLSATVFRRIPGLRSIL